MLAVHSKDTLRSAVRKISWFRVREWCGHLTPVEILALVKAGAKPRNPQELERCVKTKKEGCAFKTWFYFTPSDDLLEQIEKEKR